MAEVATKKSINVVSSKKSDVCGVQSNNGLIDLDNISASNNQLIALCDNNDDDDDLVLTNNSRNELDGEDKSLQELIENELALRICSKNDSNEDDEVVEETIEDAPDTTSNQPETVKRIVLDRQQQEHVDVNAEFIIAETEHCALIEEPYGYQNGHATPDASVLRATYGGENAQPEPVTTTTVENFRDNKETQEEKDRWNAVENEHDRKEPQVFDEQPEGSGIMITIRKTSDDSIDPSRRSEPEPREEEEVDEKLFARYDQEQAEFRCVAKDHYDARTIDDLSTSEDPAERADEKDDVAASNTILPDDVESCPPMSCPDKYHDEEEEPNRSKVLEDSDENVLLMDACSQVHEELRRASVDLLDTWTDHVPSAESHQAGQFSDNFDETLCQENQTAEELVRESKQKIEVRDRRLALELDGTSGGDGFFRTIDGTPEDEELQGGIGEHRHSSFDDSKDAIVRTASPQEGLDVTPETDVVCAQDIDDAVQSRSFDEGTPSQSDAASTQEFIDTERRILTEESADPDVQKPVDTPDTLTSEDVDRQMEDLAFKSAPGEDVILTERNSSIEEDEKEVFVERKFEEGPSEAHPQPEARETLDSWVTVEEATKPEDDSSEERLQEQDDMCDDHEVKDTSMVDDETEGDEDFESPVSRAPLATPDETSDFSNTFDSESREETISTSSSVVTSSSTIKGGTKTKKKKIEGVSGNDASPNLTPRTKKTKKSKKSDLEKENISVNCNFQDPSMIMGTREPQPEMIDFSDEYDLSNVNVKSLKSSFNKFDALSKKTVLHVRSVDAGKVQQQLNAVGQNGDNTNPNCRSCGKVVFQMEQTKAEGLVWHKNCFRCVQCSKQLNVDNYESHESTLYCKPHFKELFQPKPVEESDQPASDKPDLGLEELSSLNVKSRFQVFEKAGTENANEIERSPSQIAVKRSPSILSKLAKFQAKGMDIGVADESLNGIPYEESSESEEDIDREENEEVDTEIVKAKRATRERPISFSKMDDIKNRWETTSQQGRREVQREARKEEIAGIRSRLFMGKQGKMKEMYQQAVAGSDRVTKINAAEEIQHSTHARSIKERFERGEPIAVSDDEIDNKPKPEKADEEVIAAGISRKSRSLFLELDASAAKTGRPVTPVNPKTPADAPRRARDMDSPEREIYRDPDVVRAEDRVNEVVHTDTARKMLTIFRQMEENACKEDLPDGPKPLKRFTPPPEDKFAKPTASDSEEDEEEEGEESEAEDSNEERDPNYVRASDKVEDEFLKQAQNAARAKTLRLKFEHWEETDGKVSNQHHTPEMDMAQGEQSSIESASSLRAHFESLGSQSNESPRTPKVKVNRFVEIQSGCTDVCESCEKKVYPLEKVETNNKIFHKQCFRCLQCNCILRMDTFTLNNGKLYCIPHFKQLFITRGNYDEGFGVDPHKNKWATASPNGPATPIAVTNGDV